MLVHFAHANGIPGQSYQPLFDRLAPHQVFANPRFGHDPKFPPSQSWRFLADELITYVERYAQEPVVGVGHSMGSLVTFIAACVRPDLFRGVLILDPPLFWGHMAWMCKLLKLTGHIDEVSPAKQSKNRRRVWPDKQKALEYFASKKLFQFHPDCFEAFCNAAVTVQDNGEVKLFFDVDVEVEIFRNTPDNLRRYKRPANMPMRLVYADQSNASRENMVTPFCRHFDIPYERISGEHMYPLQQPDLTVDIIRRFLKECE